AVAKAKGENMPKENIERAIKKGTGELDGGQMEELTYEGYGTDGIAFLVDVLTDNKNRTLADVKRIFNRGGGSLASAGSVAWQFEQKGQIILSGTGLDFDEVFMAAAEAGADDVVDEDGTVVVYTPREKLRAVEQALTDAGYQVSEAELYWDPQNESELPPDRAIANMKIAEQL